VVFNWLRGVVAMEAIDLIGDPAVIAKIVVLAKSQGFSVSEPMPVNSISDALDAPFGLDEFRQIAETVTVMSSAGVSFVGFLAAVKSLLGKSETSTGGEPSVEAKHTISETNW
jgi:hypothetical protein